MTTDPGMGFDTNAWVMKEDTFGTTAVATYDPVLIGVIKSMEAKRDTAAVENTGCGRQLPYNITPSFIKCTYPVKYAWIGDTWENLLGWTLIDDAHNGYYPQRTIQPFSIISEQKIISSQYETELTCGAMINSHTIEINWEENSPIMSTLDIWAKWHQSEVGENRATAWNFDDTTELQDIDFPTNNNVAPAADLSDDYLITSGDVVLKICTSLTNALTIDGPVNSWITISDDTIKCYNDGDLDTNVNTNGIIDLTSSSYDTLTEVASEIDGSTGWTCSVHGDATGSHASHLLENIQELSTATSTTLQYAETYTNANGQGQTSASIQHSIPHVQSAKINISNELDGTSGSVYAQDGTTAINTAYMYLYKTNFDASTEITKYIEESESWPDWAASGTEVPLVRYEINDNGTWHFISLWHCKVLNAPKPWVEGSPHSQTLSLKPQKYDTSFSCYFG